MQTLGNITFEITRRCHRRCSFCYLPELRSPRADAHGELTPTEIGAAAAQIMSSSGCRRVQLSGGEPLLRGDVLEIVGALRHHGAEVSILTDGAQLDERLAASLERGGVTMLQPTLLSANPDTHDELRGKGAFRDVTRAIAVAAAAGLRVSVSMVVTRRNFGDAGGVAELAFALGASGLALSRYCPSVANPHRIPALMPEPEHVREAAQAASKMCRAVGLPLSAAITIPRCVWTDPVHPPLRSGICSLVGPKATVTVGPDGSVRSCSLSQSCVGSIRSEPWKVLWDRLVNEELAKLRAAVPAACRACPWLRSCLGGCRMAARAARGTFDAPDPLAPCAPRSC